MSKSEQRRTLILTPFIPDQDSRANRLAGFIRGRGAECEIVGVSLAADSPGPRGRLAGRWGRYVHAWRVLSDRSNGLDQVVAVNCEICLVAWCHRALHRGHLELVLDVYDHHGDVFESPLLSAIFVVLEAAGALLADRLVLPIRERLAQYPKGLQERLARKALFISNVGFELRRAPECTVPATGSSDRSVPIVPDDADPLRVVYCGNVDYSRGLDVLIAAVQKLPGKCELTIHGGGVALETFQKQVLPGGNVRFAGQFSNSQLAQLAKGHDLFWAAYDLRIRNNRYCDPNKFRDHLLVNLPIVTNPGHPLATLVERSGSGFVVPLDETSLRKFLSSVERRSVVARNPECVGAAAVLAEAIQANRSAGESLAAVDS